MRSKLTTIQTGSSNAGGRGLNRGDELRDPAIIEELRVFDAAIKLKLDGPDDVTGDTVRCGRG
jgi:hypothetical protein